MLEIIDLVIYYCEINLPPTIMMNFIIPLEKKLFNKYSKIKLKKYSVFLRLQSSTKHKIYISKNRINELKQ